MNNANTPAATSTPVTDIHRADPNKVYVRVIVGFDSDGKMSPQVLIWDDDRKYKIDKVIDVRQAAARKCGGQGDRYTVRIQGKDRELFFERNASTSGRSIGKWFVERKGA